ncbi:MAG TPA: 3-dehydroquinate synthase [Candidatus Dormibacteraeota bacterium]
MNNVVLIGFMGSGKSTVGPQLAQRMVRPFVDLDDVIEADAGRSVAEIFSSEGETGFREREARCLQRALERSGSVVAVGGGAPMRDENWVRIRDGNCVVALIAEPDELARRLDGSTDRPLLQSGAPSAIASLLPRRLPRYLEADLVIKTDGIAPAEVAQQLHDRLSGRGLQRIQIDVPGSPHDVTVGYGLSHLVPAALRGHSPTVVVTDHGVGRQYGQQLIDALSAAGLSATLHLVPAGEAAKTLAVLSGIYEALAAAGVGRRGALIARGGGSVGDVAGFAAATWMRGIPYVQMPTTLLAMVDSSIGGKTAINLPAGKNLAGALHQPAAIFCDLECLATLPDEEYRSGLAEIIKAALIADRSFAVWLSANMSALLRRNPATVREAVARAIGIKAAVVAKDPNEKGERAILNYGHTVGHALERAIGFGKIRHGYAVAWGMEMAARISLQVGACTPESVDTQHALLSDTGLLVDRPVVPHATLIDAMRHDKKSQSGEPRWVLLREIGRAGYGERVDRSIVRVALAEVLPE